LTENRSSHRRRASSHVNHNITFSEITYGNVRCLLGDAPRGASTVRPQVHPDDYEVCWVLSGRLLFHLPHETQELHAGDAIQFDGVLDHRYEALADSTFMLLHLRKGKRF
jgi:mannose-6-phosphate isomerase-like protein (cupin superfamily)